MSPYFGIPASKTCTSCGETKPLEGFSVRPPGQGLYGRDSQCKSCKAAYKREFRKTYPARVVPRETEYRKAHRAAERALREMFPVLFQILYEAEKARRGLGPFS